MRDIRLNQRATVCVKFKLMSRFSHWRSIARISFQATPAIQPAQTWMATPSVNLGPLEVAHGRRSGFLKRFAAATSEGFVARVSVLRLQNSESQTLLERLEAENRKLRAVAVELILQVRALGEHSKAY